MASDSSSRAGLKRVGLLAVDMEQYGALKLTAEYHPVTRGQRQVLLRKDAKPEKKTKAPTEKTAKPESPQLGQEQTMRRLDAILKELCERKSQLATSFVAVTLGIAVIVGI